ncbi:hypothetical protein [Azospirillum rugosum]|uniref:Uncharacterized protein n=1 Tax=Azospirillum rugosum TaxID=416170 RepID=A0ABS4SEM7_9PROT|nr:hypothetical protein [Azospirillum rugosum]MBP2291030.1 hypothetical protein [Azospirillum rugosum]MDQ0524906.1 hypothetical protein [Azospirillum rugosum]
MPTLTIPQRKRLRALVIAQHVRETGLPGVVCFSCGNASRALKEVGLYTVEIAPGGDLSAGKWWTASEIAKAWPHLLDATSGHLPVPVMAAVATALRDDMGELPADTYDVPTGSGETLVCLAMAYPDSRFRPVYGVGKGTAFEPFAPLNGLVLALAGGRVDLHGGVDLQGSGQTYTVEA